ncbi:MHYT domain-containing protein [Streptomonospora sediminis]
MIEQFAYGWTTPVIAYVVSFLGSLVGLQVAGRARQSQGALRAGWLALAAFTLGAAAIWAMHFIAMMGFSVQAITLRYDVVLTLVSGLVAIAATAAALTWATARPGWPSVLGGGLLMGAGVAAMHYLGMASIEMPVRMHHDTPTTAAAVAIALAASAAALVFALRLKGLRAALGGSLIMAAAVSAMHYTAMSGVSVGPIPQDPLAAPTSGATMMDFFLPVFVGLGLLLMIISLILLLSPGEEDEPQRRASPTPQDAGAADSVFTRRH